MLGTSQELSLGAGVLDPGLEKGWAVMSLLQWSAEAQSTEETELFCFRSKEGSRKCLKTNVNFYGLLNLIFIYVHCIHTVFRNSKTEYWELIE